MDNTPQNSPQQGVVSELQHITEEIYKKNAELAYTNKVLTILRKVDSIILGSVTDPVQVAQQVANTVVPIAEYKSVTIVLVDQEKKELVRLAVSQTTNIGQAEEAIQKKFTDIHIPLTATQNIVVQAVTDKAKKQTEHSYDVLTPVLTEQEAQKVQELVGITSIFVYPLIIRSEVLGAMIIGRSEKIPSLSNFDYDLMDRLTDSIGIALDNALLYQKIQAANVKLKELDKLKDEFVSLASHELRTPLTAIKSYLWMALEGKGGPLNEKQKYYLDRSYTSADRLGKLVNDMLNVSRIESGRITLEKKEVSLPKLTEDVIAEVSPHAQELGVKVAYIKAENLADVSADGDKIKEVLINLIGNALKFTPKGGQVNISFAQKDGFVETSVTDTGRGIAPENMNKLFQKFGILEGTYQNDPNGIKGTGLGLYITKSIVELHGGKTVVTSPGVNQGTTFAFTLPVYTKQEQTVA